MIKEQVEKKMKKALSSFAEKLNETPDNISFFIHTKPESKEDKLYPKYFYAKNGVPVTDDNGKLKDLKFTQDILGLKFDLLGVEAISAQFLSTYFTTISNEYNISPRNLYIKITSKDKDCKELDLALYEGGEVIKKLTLDDIFGE